MEMHSAPVLVAIFTKVVSFRHSYITCEITSAVRILQLQILRKPDEQEQIFRADLVVVAQFWHFMDVRMI